MISAVTELARHLEAAKCIMYPVMLQVVHVASKMQKPLIIEGPSGCGKTELAVAIASAGDSARTFPRRESRGTDISQGDSAKPGPSGLLARHTRRTET